MRRDFIVVHHSLTQDAGTVSWGAIQRHHVAEKGWRDIGYHAGVEHIGGEPFALYGRDLNEQAAAAVEADMNARGLHVCVVGNFDMAPPDPEALAVLARRIILPWMRTYGIPADRVIGHRDVGMMAGYDWTLGQYKSCPGKLFDLEALRSLVR